MNYANRNVATLKDQKDIMENMTLANIEKRRQETDKEDPPPSITASAEEREIWIARNFPYASSFESFQGMQLPAASALWGYDDGWFRHRMTHEIVNITQYAGRRLGIEEYHAFTQVAASKLVAQSYDRPIAIGLVGWLVKSGWSNMSVGPFSPGHLGLNVVAFPTVASPVLEGAFALAAWQVLRCGLCGAIGYLTYRLVKPIWDRLFSVHRGVMETPVAWISPRLHKFQADAQKNHTKATAKETMAKRTRRA